MARLPRAVFPGLPHHVTQRGNGRAQTFFRDEDYRLYLRLLAEHCSAAKVEIWGWVLMPNHVHLILVPDDADGIRRALAPVHRRYAGSIHAREQRTGHFWQGRFGCVAMDEAHLRAALRYVTLNPVRARLVERATDWPWSSVQVHLGRTAQDGVTSADPIRERYPDFAELVEAAEEDDTIERLRRAETIGRPVGNADFIAGLEFSSGRRLVPNKRGPKKSALSP